MFIQTPTLMEEASKPRPQASQGNGADKGESVYPQEITATLTSLFKQRERNLVIFLQGPPGIGKTATVGQAAQRATKQLSTFALPYLRIR
jgi:MoxR-like ATPase